MRPLWRSFHKGLFYFISSHAKRVPEKGIVKFTCRESRVDNSGTAVASQGSLCGSVTNCLIAEGYDRPIAIVTRQVASEWRI